MNGCVVMSSKDQKNYSRILDVIEGRLSLTELSLLSEKSYRQCQRMVSSVKENGMKGIQHGNMRRTPVNKSSPLLKQDVLRLMKQKYFDFNLTHFAEKLLVCEGIRVKRETLRTWAHEVGTPKKARRRSKKIHQLRPRMPRTGMLIQFDGSDHDWFSGNGPRAVLVGGIDDASGEVLHIEFFPAEDTWSCLKVIREITEKYGVAEAYYLDQAGHFGKKDSEQDVTQVGRALQELGMKAILASTPQAKGRVERLWGTLQDRLVAELRLHGINRMPTANDFIKTEFLPAYNVRFSVSPRNPETAFKAVPQNKNLRDIFCIKETRKISGAQQFSYGCETYLVERSQDYRFRTVHIHRHDDGKIEFQIHGRNVQVTKMNKDRTEILKVVA
jgi:transposase